MTNTFLQKALLRTKKNKKQNGFTLIELMVVVAIVGVLSAVGLPQLLKAQDRAKISVAQQEAVNYAKECSISLLTGADAPTASEYETVTAGQTCAVGTDVTAASDTTPAVTFTVKMTGGIPSKPSSSEDAAGGGGGGAPAGGGGAPAGGTV